MKSDRAGWVARKHAIEHQRVDVDVEIQGAAKPLDDGHRSPTRLLDTGRAGVVPQAAEHGPEEHGGDAPGQVVIPCEPIPHPVRQTQHPWPDGDVRDDVINDGCLAFPRSV